MGDNDDRTGEAAELRRRAEAAIREKAASSPDDAADLSPEEVRRTLHELRVHQIELQMQNEELRGAQAALDAERARYFDLYDLAPVGYVTVSDQGLILEANLAAATLLGAARGSLVRQPFSRFILREDQDRYYLRRKRLIESGEPQAVEVRMTSAAGNRFWAHLTAVAAQDAAGANVCRILLSDVSERRQAADLLLLQSEILAILAEPCAEQQAAEGIVAALKRATGFDGVGLRLQRGDDYPFLASDGYSDDFLRTENTLAVRDPDGGLCRNEDGAVSLECTCGLVLRGGDNPLFSPGGSVWTNDSLPFLDLPPEQDPRLHPRNRCVHVGFRSVALVPLRAAGEILGLLHLADRRTDRFTAALVHFLEGIAASIGVAFARRRSAAAIQQKDAERRSLIENLQVGIVVHAADTSILLSNPTAATLLGLTEEQLLGKTATDPAWRFLDEDGTTTPRAAYPVNRVLASGQPLKSQVLGICHPDRAGPTWVLCNAYPVRNPDGSVAQTIVTFIDITELKRSEEALITSRRRLAETESVARIGGWEFDIDTKRQTWTEETCRIHELGPDFNPTVGSGIVFYSPASRSIIAEAVRRTLEDGTPFDLELEIVTAKGNLRNVHVIGQADFANRRVYGFIQDITERVRLETERERLARERVKLEDQLRQSQKVEAIGRLAGGVAHDFNNLTAIVLGYAEMLLAKLGPADPARKYVEQILAAGRRSATLTRQLLAFSRKQALKLEVLDLHALLRNFAPLLGRLIGADIALDLTLAAEPCRVTADAGQLEQVLTNLALNARDAMPQGGTLKVETDVVELAPPFAPGDESFVPGRYVLLALTDSGCGMDEAELSHLFEPFYTTKEKGKGTGLGLATAYGIVRQFGGDIRVSSTPGVGTTFRIYLRWTDARHLKPPAESGGELPRGGGESILVVEDEPALRELVATTLAGLGYRVSAAANGAEGLRSVLEQGLRPDLVLTDVVMPVMSGVEMVRRLGRELPGVKALFMSGYPDAAGASHGVLERGVNFIQKPFTEGEIAGAISRTLAARSAPTAPACRRVLMIDDDEQYRELVQHFCTKRGHVFAGVDSAAAAIEALAGQDFDVLLVDLNIPGTSGAQVLREVRAVGHTAPAIVLTGDVASADMDVLRPLGVVSALEKSGSAEPLLQAIEAAVG